jgi:hypothetical protein
MAGVSNGKSQQVAYRLPHDLVAWLKAEADKREAEEPGSGTAPPDVARVLLTAAMVVSKRTGASAYAIARSVVASAGAASPPAPTVAAPAPTPAADPRQTTIPGALAPAKVAKLVVVKTPKTKGAPDHETIRLAYAAALEAGTIKPKDLAAELGFADASSLSHFKGGKRKLDAERLAKLAKRLGV